MAKKLRTGFELPFSNQDIDQTKTFSSDKNYLFSGIINGLEGVGNTTRDFNYLIPNPSDSVTIYQRTFARTLVNGTRGCIWGGNGVMLSIDVSTLNSGFFSNNWFYMGSGWLNSAHWHKLLMLTDGTDVYTIQINYNSGTPFIEVYQRGVGQISNTPISGYSNSTWYNVKCSIANNGDIEVDWNGTTISYSTGTTFATLTGVAIGHTSVNVHSASMDDLAINDGSGSSDNGIPNSIRGYNFFDQATLDSQTGFSTVGGSTILANLTDGDDATRVSAEADLSEMNFSLPTLSGTGMSETASNFTKIEAINVYGRQIESTKASSVLKAKITDATSSANREEDISLPLTVANDSAVMFDDGASDWSLANLDAGNIDLKITFDKP